MKCIIAQQVVVVTEGQGRIVRSWSGAQWLYSKWIAVPRLRAITEDAEKEISEIINFGR